MNVVMEDNKMSKRLKIFYVIIILFCIIALTVAVVAQVQASKQESAVATAEKISEEQLKKLKGDFNNIFENKVNYLKDNNYKTIVATSSNRDRVDKILAQAKITEFFDDSICGDEVTKGKPNPEVFLKSCQKLGVNVDEAIVLEDSEAGIQASYDANIKVICIPDMK